MIKVNTKPLRKELRKMKSEMNKIQAAANNRLARDAGSAIKKELRKYYNIPASELTVKRGGKVHLTRANAKKLKARLITSKGHGIKLIKFKALPRRPQGTKSVSKRKVTTAEVKKGRKVTLKSAFIAIMPSGHKGIFKRLTNRRLKIKELYGPSAHDLYQGKIVRRFVKGFVAKNYYKIYKNQYDRFKKH